MSDWPKITPEIVSATRMAIDRHRFCTTINVTTFGDPETRYVDHRCDECRARDKAVGDG